MKQKIYKILFIILCIIAIILLIFIIKKYVGRMENENKNQETLEVFSRIDENNTEKPKIQMEGNHSETSHAKHDQHQTPTLNPPDSAVIVGELSDVQPACEYCASAQFPKQHPISILARRNQFCENTSRFFVITLWANQTKAAFGLGLSSN